MKRFLMLLALIPTVAVASPTKRYVIRSSTGSKVQIQSVQILKNAKRLKHLNGVVLSISEADAKALRSQGFDVEEDGIMTIQGHRVPNTRVSRSLAVKQPVPWGIEAVKATKANQYPSGSGSGVTVCVVDTGVDYEHPALAKQVVGGEAIVKTTTEGKKDYFDDMGHGTHVSGTIAGDWQVLRGVAPKAKIYAVKVLDQDGSGYNSDIADGIKACIGHAKVINISLGGGSSSKIMQDALKDARAAGMQIACAAGNDGGSVIYPAKYPECTAISAVDDKGQIADFSSRGTELDFAAPGVAIRSTVPGGDYETWDGTSMATPHAAGVMAIMFSRKKQEPIKASDLGLPVTQQGAGQVDALKTALGK